jgi:hypothetical protein
MAFETNGTTSFLKNTTNTDGQINNADFSICAWIYAVDEGENNTGKIFMRGTGVDTAAANYIWFGMKATMTICMDVEYSTTRARYIAANNTITANRWQFVCATHDASAKTSKLYTTSHTSDDAIAEVSYGTQTTGSGTVGSDANGDIGIGCRPDSANRTFNGKISCVSVWTKMLTIGEMNEIAWRPWLPKQTDLLWFWPLLDEADGTDATVANDDVAYSFSGNAMNLTCTNNGTWREIHEGGHGPGVSPVLQVKHMARDRRGGRINTSGTIADSTSWTHCTHGKRNLKVFTDTAKDTDHINTFHTSSRVKTGYYVHTASATMTSIRDATCFRHHDVQMETSATQTGLRTVSSNAEIVHPNVILKDGGSDFVATGVTEDRRFIWVSTASKILKIDPRDKVTVRSETVPSSVVANIYGITGLEFIGNRLYASIAQPGRRAVVILDPRSLEAVDVYYMPLDVTGISSDGRMTIEFAYNYLIAHTRGV